MHEEQEGVHESEPDYRAEIVVTDNLCSKESRVRSLFLSSPCRREAVALAETVVERWSDGGDFGAITWDSLRNQEWIEPIQLLGVQEWECDCEAHPWTKEEIESGLAGRLQEIQRPTLQAVAFHESGHTFMYYMFGIDVSEVYIHDDAGEDGTFGATLRRLPVLMEATEENIVRHLAGSVAECMAGNGSWSLEGMNGGLRYSGGSDDYVTALALTAEVHGFPPPEQWNIGDYRQRTICERYLQYIASKAERILHQHWRFVETLAELLVEKRTITGDDVKRILKDLDQSAAAA